MTGTERKMEQKHEKIYTGQGDKGLTALTSAAQVSKADERVAAVGGVEEVIAALGMVKAATACPVFRGKLERIQKTLRTMTQGLADPRSGRFVFSAEEIGFLETDMDKMRERIPSEAIRDALPGACEQSARLDVACATTRRAERAVIAMDRRYAAPAAFKSYINRLSDYLLVAARYADVLAAEADTAANGQATAPAAPFGVATRAASAEIHTATPVSPMASPVAATSNESLIAEVIARLGGAKVMNLEKAKALINAVEMRAQAEGKHAVIAVADAAGNPVAVHVMDGAFLVSYEVAVKKAYTAVAVKMSTMELSALCQPGGTFYGLQGLDKVITFGGGIPLYADGVIVGGLGVSGGTGEEDHDLALYGAAAFQTI